MSCKHPCPQCPWRVENHGKRHFCGFFTKANLTRLWNGIRKGEAAMSCHMTDPTHPDHVKSGAPVNATPQECPGSVILVLRELRTMAGEGGVIGAEQTKAYYAARPRGLTKFGVLNWAVQRFHFGGVPLIGGAKLPDVDIDEPGVSLPAYLDPTRGAK